MTKAALFCLAAGIAAGQTVSLTVNTGTVLHDVNPRIYGLSLGPIHRSVNGGLRPDLAQAVAALHPTIVRWPGGDIAREYKWKDGIGARSDPLSFGIDEFVAFARKAGAEPVIVIPAGPRDQPDRAARLKDAVDLVEYCNGPRDSAWGRIRAQNGHPEPYRVRYWQIDTETWKLFDVECAEALGQFVPAMKKVDAAIRTIGQGSLADYLNVHHAEEAKNAKLRLFVSGWNEPGTDWRGGLHAGATLNAMEHDAAVAMATASPDNALIDFDQSTWYPSPEYVVLKLYRDHFAPDLLEIALKPGELSAVATRTADGEKIYVKLVNARERDVPVEVVLRGDFPLMGATLRIVAPDSLDARNTLQKPAAIQAVDGKLERSGMTVRLRLPRWSVAVVTLSR